MLYYKALPTKTVKEALFSPSPSLALIKKEIGDDKAKAFISVIITDLVMSFNVGKTMNQSQVLDIVELVQNNYYFLKPSEFKYCFDNAKMGRYGQLYDRIDGSIIFGWIEKYLEERMEVCITENQNQNKQHLVDGAHEDILVRILNKLDEEKTPVNTFIPQSDELRAKSNEIFLEFDFIYDQNPIGNTGKKFIDYKGKIVDQTEYLEIRLKE